MTALIQSGYLYELAGLLGFIVYLRMASPRMRGRFSRRTLALMLLASIGLVGTVPLHYAAVPAAIIVVDVLVLAAFASSFVDQRARRP